MDTKQKRTVCFVISILILGFSLTAQVTTSVPASPSPQAPETNQLARPIGLAGTWVPVWTLHDLFGTLKEVKGGLFFTEIQFLDDGTGYMMLGGQKESFEYERKDSQLTLAYGSRLDPQLDLFRIFELQDGNLYMRSTHLAKASGNVTYLLTRSNQLK